MFRSIVLTLLFCFIGLPEADGQYVVSGRVEDARTGEALPGATIQIDGSFTGTVANSIGQFNLELKTLPATLVVRFIGYESTRRLLDQLPGRAIMIALTPTSLQLPEITVSGEDPAVQIMRRVIEEKEKWWKSFDSYRVHAYNRFRMENDTGIVSIWESGTIAWWDRERGTREVSVWQRRTRNMAVEDLLPAALFIQNLYDDDIEVAGHRLMGVTNPGALSYYRFHLDGTRARDGTLVYDLSVEPRSDLASGFSGTLAVLDSAFAVIAMDLKPAGAFLFPPPIQELDITYRQQFAGFGSDVWLPVDFLATMDIKVGLDGVLAFPVFRIRQLSRLTDFELNVEVPDSLYASNDIVSTDSTTITEDSSARFPLAVVPLTPEEDSAYVHIDSTLSISKAFPPSGLLARFVKADVDADEKRGKSRSRRPSWRPTSTPQLWYNRVEGLHAGLRLTGSVNHLLRASAEFGYGFERKGWTWAGTAGIGNRVRLEGGFSDRVQTQFQSEIHGQLFNSLNVLAGRNDYFDYLHEREWHVTGAVRPREIPGWVFALTYGDYHHDSEPVRVSRGFLGNRLPLLNNAPVSVPNFKTLMTRIEYEGDSVPYGIGPKYVLRFGTEHRLDQPEVGRRFTRYTADITWRFPTFYRRRLLPNTLDVRVTAATFSGMLPRQRFGIVDGTSLISTFGGLRTRSARPYIAPRFAALNWEHNFRTIFFERLGWRGAVDRGWNLILHGGHAWFWLPSSNSPAGRLSGLRKRTHHELGGSVSGILKVLRVDFTFRLDRPSFRVGIAAARIF